MTENIKQVDPHAAYLELQPQIDAAVQEVVASGWYLMGQQVASFEEALAASVGAGHAIGAGNGTDALELCLRAADIGEGDIVVTVSHTAVATVAAIELAGAAPLLVDIDPLSYTMDPAQLALAIEQHPERDRIKAIIVVHLYGCPAEMDSIAQIASRYDLMLIEDCAQAQGASYRGQAVGSMGAAATFSFYPTKNLGALGDGGALLVHSPALEEQARVVAQYGWRERFVSHVCGMNTRLDEIQAAVLNVKLPHLAHHNQRRREIAMAYTAGLEACAAITTPLQPKASDHVFHQYVIETSARDALASFLQEHGIATGIHYPMPVHLQPAYKNRVDCGPGGMQHTEAASSRILSLPMYPQLTDAQVGRVCETICKWQAAER